MEKSIFKICITDGSKGSGFFCKIPLPDKNFIPVFITNNHVVNEKYLNKEKEIKIKMVDNDDWDKIKIKTISIKDSLYYTNEDYDITIIEIKMKNNDDSYEFLELDDNILDDNGLGYIGNSIYLLHYPSHFEEDKVAVSYGIIKNRFENKTYDFIHYCSTEYGSSGSPILNVSNNKVIGIHKKRAQKEYNIGLFLHESIKIFINEYNNKKKIVNSESNNIGKNVLIQDLTKTLKIPPKTIADIDTNILQELKGFFNDYRCIECLKSVTIDIQRKKENNILYLTINCKNNHKEIKQISNFLKDNKFTINNDFTFYDLVPSDIRKKENDPNVRKLNKYEFLTARIYLYEKIVVLEDELYLICFKCKKIFDLKKNQLDGIRHEHFLFKYYILGESNDEDDKNSKHFFQFKDINYLEKKIKQEEEYFNSLNELLIQYKLKDNYISYLKQIESEIYFFKNYYKLYMNNKSIRMFNNIKNIFNHTLIPFKLEKDDIKINKLEKEVKDLNNKLFSIYSLNNFSNKEKIKISDYEQHIINPPDSVFVSTSLDKPYFAAGGRGLYVYKIKEKEDKKHTITLVSKNKNLNIIVRMIYLNNKKLIIGGLKGIYLIKYNKDFNSMISFFIQIKIIVLMI